MIDVDELITALQCIGNLHPEKECDSVCGCPYFVDTKKTGLAYRCNDLQAVLDAADALKQLQAENKALKDKLFWQCGKKTENWRGDNE